jgi:hypothetical protein
MPLAIDCDLYPYVERCAEELLKLDDLDSAGDVRPIVMPAHNAVAGLRNVAMRSETAGSKLKLDPYTSLGLACVAIRDAVRKGGSDLLNSELQSLGNVGEEEDDAKFVVRRVLEGCVLQQRGSFRDLHHDKI